MALYQQNGTSWFVSSREAMNLHEKLPAATYALRVQGGPAPTLYLEHVDNFTLPDKIYGNYEKDAKRILKSFSERPSTTGVLLNGERGSGKSMLAKLTSDMGRKIGVPTIIIDLPIQGPMLNGFMQAITDPAIILIDEFEKLYTTKTDSGQTEENQDGLLTLLDGTFASKKLFLLTANDKNSVNEYLKNRPGRIYYLMDFSGVDSDFVREYATDNLSNKTNIEPLVEISSIFGTFNFDMLQALVEECNRFDETPKQALKYLNARLEFNGRDMYRVDVTVNGAPVNLMSRDEVYISPLQGFGLTWRSEDGGEEYVEVGSNDLKSMKGGVFIYEPGASTVVKITRSQRKKFSFGDAC